MGNFFLQFCLQSKGNLFGDSFGQLFDVSLCIFDLDAAKVKEDVRLRRFLILQNVFVVIVLLLRFLLKIVFKVLFLAPLT